MSFKKKVAVGATDTTFAERIIAWQHKHGRHDLPWQKTRDPYRVWLSEIMLQQTQVAAVIPYYQRFLHLFPTIADLAQASSDAVMAAWSGLGYYARARNLHRCAQIICKQYGGIFPKHAADIETLPGIGRSTAAAIAAFCFGERAAILDGNVKRVLCRHFGITGFPGQAAVERLLWALAAQQLPTQEIESYTQGLMDMGATVCQRTKPLCMRCPVQTSCVAWGTGRTAQLPTPRPTRAQQERHAILLVIHQGEDVLLEKRPPMGIWGGLWCLPQIDLEAQLFAAGIVHPEIQQRIITSLALYGVSASITKNIAEDTAFMHVFTHFKLHVLPVHVCLTRKPFGAEQSGRMWVALSEINHTGVPVPVRRVLAKF